MDQWVGIAEDLLGAAAIVAIEDDNFDEIVGLSPQAEALDLKTIGLAARLAPSAVDDEGQGTILHGETAILHGETIDAPSPYDRALSVRALHKSSAVRVIIFPGKEGIAQPLLQRFIRFIERRMAERALTDRYRTDLKHYIGMLRALERTAKIGLWDLDVANRELWVSDEVRRMFRCPPRGPIKISQALVSFPRQARRQLVEAFMALSHDQGSHSLAVPIHTPGGSEPRTVRIFVSPRKPDEADRFYGVIQDVTEQQIITERLWWMANHDALTELPNRALFADRFQRALERRARTKQLVGLILLDVDKFKAVNDTYGHGAGDEYLRQIAKQLRDTVRGHDTVARTGGDEFSILLEDIAGLPALDAVLSRIKKALTVPFTWEGHDLEGTLSAGVAIAPDHGMTDRDLSVAADLALYRSKGQPGDGLSIYQAEYGRAAAARATQIAGARKALKEDRFVPHYQPHIAIGTGEVVAVEVLARWMEPPRIIEAESFKDALTDDDTGPLIGRAVIGRAISEMAALNAGRATPLALCVNATAAEILRADFLGWLQVTCSKAGFEGGVTVEISEEMMRENDEAALSTLMDEARARSGIGFALDAFGDGFGSILHLTRLPIGAVNVARTLTAGLPADRQKTKLLRGILDMAQALGIKVVVQGVETAEQAAQLHAIGAQTVQGHHYTPPVSYASLRTLLEDGKSLFRAA
ncbi:MAG: EAL domain-containing protein [Pseudomonadota bacterium]